MIKMRLMRLLRGAGKYIVYQILWQWLSLLVQIVIVWNIAGLIEDVRNQGIRTERILVALGIILPGLLLRFVCDRLYTAASFRASADVKRILRGRIYQKILRLGPSYREQIGSAELVQMSGEGVEQLETYFGRYLSQFFYALLAPLTLFFVLSPIDLRTATLLLLAVPLIPVVIMLVMLVAKRLLSRYFDIYYGLGDSFLEKLQGMTTLKIYQADQAAVGIVSALARFASGELSLAGVLMFILLAAEFFLPMRILGSFFHIGMNGMKASDRIFAFLDLPEPEVGKAELGAGHIDIRMEALSFSYEESRPILKGITLELPAQSFVSLVGVSGSGKSTIAGILMGRNRGYGGSLRLNGEELSRVSTESLMNHLTMVGHDSRFFRASVRENLLLAKPEATELEMKEALRKVNLLSFIEAQGGLEMQLASNGSNLSGGQKQRLALARALLHDTPVYIFEHRCGERGDDYGGHTRAHKEQNRAAHLAPTCECGRRRQYLYAKGR